MLAPQAQASRAAKGLWSVEARRHVFCAKGACDCREFRARWSLCKHGQLHGRRAGSSWRTSRLRLIDRQRGDRGGGELTMLLLQEESALVARDFWRSAPPLVAVPSELLAFDFEAGSPSLPPELATKEGKHRGGPLNPARLSAGRSLRGLPRSMAGTTRTPANSTGLSTATSSRLDTHFS